MRVAATLDLRGTLQLVSLRDAPCPPGAPSGVLCPGRSGRGVVPGLGSVTESYAYFADPMPPSCTVGVRILGYPVRWTVAGKGEIHFTVSEHPDCLSETVAFTADQSFTITGGTGIYAGASGTGTVDRQLTQTASGAEGPETWTGTLDVPGLTFDLKAPAITGAKSKTVRVSKRANRVRVTYSVTATDDVDRSIAVACRPPSGSRFKIGRTVVRCTAIDASGNTATATFTVTVRRRP